jgi:hypothetical protein
MRIAPSKGVALHRRLAEQRRRVNPQARRALEILGHAIEYLTDEFISEFEDAPAAWRTDRLVSIQLLSEINRRIYFECEEAPGIKDHSNSLAWQENSAVHTAGGGATAEPLPRPFFLSQKSPL